MKILENLKDQNLLTDQTLLMFKENNTKMIVNFRGELIENDLFKNIQEDFAIFTYGTYSKVYVQRGKALIASSDDASQMFGHKVKCIKDKTPKSNALIFNEGFLVVGRSPDEVITASILIEKMCKAELLAPKIGKIKYLNRVLSKIEHVVYKNIYSKKALKIL